MKIRKQRKRNHNKKIIKKIIDFSNPPIYNSIKAAGAGLSGSGSLNTIFGGYAMKKKVTKSFALDQNSIDLIQEIKNFTHLKNDSEVVTYALFYFKSDMKILNLKQIELDIARNNYMKLMEDKYNNL